MVSHKSAAKGCRTVEVTENVSSAVIVYNERRISDKWRGRAIPAESDDGAVAAEALNVGFQDGRV